MQHGLFALLPLLGSGCSEDATQHAIEPPDRTVDDSAIGKVTPTDTGTSTEPYTNPCLDPPPPGPRDVSTISIATEEDFDFDADGWLIYQSYAGIVAEQPGGVLDVIAPGVGGDPSGIQVISDGNIVTLDRAVGTLRHVERATGNGDLLVSSLVAPNGIEVGAEDRVYMTEPATGRVAWYDMATGQMGNVTSELGMPNNLVLSNDEQKLYVATLSGIAELSRTGPDTWNPAPTNYIGAALGMILTVEIDECDDLYTVASQTVYRIFSDGSGYEPIADLPLGGFPSSIRWGNGVGVFERDTLYVTMRSVIHAVDVGRRGRPHPTSP